MNAKLIKLFVQKGWKGIALVTQGKQMFSQESISTEELTTWLKKSVALFITKEKYPSLSHCLEGDQSLPEIALNLSEDDQLLEDLSRLMSSLPIGSQTAVPSDDELMKFFHDQSTQ